MYFTSPWKTVPVIWSFYFLKGIAQSIIIINPNSPLDHCGSQRLNYFISCGTHPKAHTHTHVLLFFFALLESESQAPATKETDVVLLAECCPRVHVSLDDLCCVTGRTGSRMSMWASAMKFGLGKYIWVVSGNRWFLMSWKWKRTFRMRWA